MAEIIKPIEIDSEFKQQVDEDMSFTEEEKESGSPRFLASRRNPAIFMREMVGVQPYYWQARVLTDIGRAIRGEMDTKRFAILTSRQIGKSTLLANLSLWTAMFNHAAFGPHNTTKIGSFSMTDVQSKKLMGEIKKWMHSGDAHMREEIGEREFFTSLIDTDEANNKTTVTFEAYDPSLHGEVLKGAKVGPSIHTYPPTESALGETFSAGWLDEANKIPDYFYEEIFSQTMNASDGVQVFTSTPYESSGFFYEIIKNREDLDVKVYSFTIDALRAEELEHAQTQVKSVENTMETLRTRGKYDAVDRQYYCEFIQGKNQYFDPDLVEGLFSDGLSQVKESEEPVDVGIDFGGSKSSHTVVTVSTYDEENDRIERLYHKRYEIQGDLNLLEDLEIIHELFNVQRVIPEVCPAGDHYIQKMKNNYGWNVKPFNPSGDKASAYSAFDTWLRQGRIYSYPDEDLEEEMKALEREEMRRTTRIEAPRNYTDDMIDSFVMSTWFFVKEDNSGSKSLFSLYK